MKISTDIIKINTRVSEANLPYLSLPKTLLAFLLPCSSTNRKIYSRGETFSFSGKNPKELLFSFINFDIR